MVELRKERSFVNARKLQLLLELRWTAVVAAYLLRFSP
jgi:hypothetical protein